MPKQIYVVREIYFTVLNNSCKKNKLSSRISLTFALSPHR